MKRRLFSFLLAVVMVFSLASVGFAAETEAKKIAFIGEDGYATLAEAVQKAEDGDTVVLKEKTTGDGFDINADITIDFGGNTYTAKGGVRVYGEVTLKNGTLKASADTNMGALLRNHGVLTVAENMILDTTNVADVLAMTGQNGSETVFSGTINSAKTETAIKVTGSAEFNIEGGKVAGKIVKANDFAGELVITGGEFTDVDGVTAILEAAYETATEGGTKQAEVYHAIADEDGETAVVSKCEIVSKNVSGNCAHVIQQLVCSNEDCEHTFSGETEAGGVAHTPGDDLKVVYTHEGEEIKAEKATCGDTITTTYTCSVCETPVELNETIEHEYEEKHGDANCESNERTWKECKNCGIKTEEEDVKGGDKAAGYTHDYYTITVPGTCKTKGYTYDVCQICGFEANKTKPAVDLDGHDWKVTVTTDPVCGVEAKANKGIAVMECSLCGTKQNANVLTNKVENVLQADGTKASEWHKLVKVTLTEADCCNDRTYTLKCAYCDYVDSTVHTEENTATQHHFVKGTSKVTCTGTVVQNQQAEDGEQAVAGSVSGFVCEYCELAYSVKNGSYEETGSDDVALVHEYTYSEIVKEATCTEAGNAKVRTCVNCGKTEIASSTNTEATWIDENDEDAKEIFVFETPLADHVEKVIDAEANCVEAAYRVTICSVCKKELSKRVYVDGSEDLVYGDHVWLITIVKPADCKNNATLLNTCRNCGYSVEYVHECGDGDEHEYCSDPNEHVWADEAVTVYQEQTCTQDGVYELYCTVCKQTIDQVVVRAAHTEGDLISSEAIACGINYNVYSCANCDEQFEMIEVDAIEAYKCQTNAYMNYDAWTFDAATNCMVYTCPDCGFTYAEEYENLDGDEEPCVDCAMGFHHAIEYGFESDLDAGVEVPADAKNIPFVMTYDDAVVYIDSIYVIAYEGEDAMVTLVKGTEADCSATGLKDGYKCACCGQMVVEQEVIEKTAHTTEEIPAVAATCTATGLTAGEKCTVCGETTVEQTVVPVTAHTETVEGAVAATCTTDGFTGNTVCSVCGKLIKAGEIIPASCASANFTDVAANAWYHDEVDAVVKAGLMKGESATTFNPEGEVSRAMVATVLYRQAGSPSVAGLNNPFTDVPAGQWYTDAVIWAASKDVVKGITVTTFAPNASITREQMATMIYRANGSPAADKDALKGYTDAASISDWAVDAMAWCISEGIIKGMSSNTLVPAGVTTRAQLATILTRL